MLQSFVRRFIKIAQTCARVATLCGRSIPLLPEMMPSETARRMEAVGVELRADPAAVEELAREGYDPRYGARPLRRKLREAVEDPAAEQLLDGRLKRGDTARVVAGDSMEYLKSVREKFDLVLLDVGLKDGNGFSVCSAVKQRTKSAVIFLSASGDEYSVVTGLDLGADDYIAKPFRPRELISRSSAGVAKKP